MKFHQFWRSPGKIFLTLEKSFRRPWTPAIYVSTYAVMCVMCM